MVLGGGVYRLLNLDWFEGWQNLYKRTFPLVWRLSNKIIKWKKFPKMFLSSWESSHSQSEAVSVSRISVCTAETSTQLFTVLWKSSCERHEGIWIFSLTKSLIYPHYKMSEKRVNFISSPNKYVSLLLMVWMKPFSCADTTYWLFNTISQFFLNLYLNKKCNSLEFTFNLPINVIFVNHQSNCQIFKSNLSQYPYAPHTHILLFD